MARRTKAFPANSRASWFAYYVARFNKFEHPDAAHLALWYFWLLLAEGSGDGTSPAPPPRQPEDALPWGAAHG